MILALQALRTASSTGRSGAAPSGPRSGQALQPPDQDLVRTAIWAASLCRSARKTMPARRKQRPPRGQSQARERLPAREPLPDAFAQVKRHLRSHQQPQSECGAPQVPLKVTLLRYRSTQFCVRKNSVTCGAPLRNRTVDLLLTMKHRTVRLPLVEALTRQYTSAPRAPASPRQALASAICPSICPSLDLAAIGVDRYRTAVGGPCNQPLPSRIPAGSPAIPGGHHAVPRNQSGDAATPPRVQHDEYVPTLAICHATMQVRPFRLPVYRTAALPTDPYPCHRHHRECRLMLIRLVGAWPAGSALPPYRCPASCGLR